MDRFSRGFRGASSGISELTGRPPLRERMRRCVAQHSSPLRSSGSARSRRRHRVSTRGRAAPRCRAITRSSLRFTTRSLAAIWRRFGNPRLELAYLSVPAGSPAGAGGFGVAIRDGARRAARETTIVGAARATVSIIRACAGCHRANNAGDLAAGGHPRLRSACVDDRSRSGRRRHAARAAPAVGDAMGVGRRWLARGGLPHADGAPPPGIDATLRYLTDRSRRSTTAAERTSNYVQLLTTCAQCHQEGRQ